MSNTKTLFKVGDKVRVCDEPPKDTNEGPSWNTWGMNSYCGKEYTIQSISKHGWISLDDDYVWAQWWLSLAVPKVPIVETQDFGML